MNDTFKPPIKSRTTSELLAIAGSPKKWNPDAVRLAKNELIQRNVDTKEIEHATKLSNEAEELEILKKATKSYKISDFIFHPKCTFFELLFTWELKKDGYLLKAKQQKTFRIALLTSITIVYLFSYIREKLH